jgi:hypothetical protein
VTEAGAAEVLRDLVERYLGGADSSLARELLREDRREVRIEIEAETLFSWDYGARMRDVARRTDDA